MKAILRGCLAAVLVLCPLVTLAGAREEVRLQVERGVRTMTYRVSSASDRYITVTVEMSTQCGRESSNERTEQEEVLLTPNESRVLKTARAESSCNYTVDIVDARYGL